MAVHVSNLAINKQSGTDNTYYGSWSFTPPRAGTLAHYVYTWFYYTGDNYPDGSKIWFTGTNSTTGDQTVTYSPPDNALEITLHVIPVSTTHEVNKTEVSWWQGSVVAASRAVDQDPWTSEPLEDIDTPSIMIDNSYCVVYTGSLEADLHPTSEILFEVFGHYGSGISIDDGTLLYYQYVPAGSGAISASFRFLTTPGWYYAARSEHRCQEYDPSYPLGYYYRYSNLTDMSEEVRAIPDIVEVFEVRAESSTSVYIAWTEAAGADEYEIQYSTTKDHVYGDADDVTTVSVTEGPYYTLTGLDTGSTYFFVVRAKNDSGESVWSYPIQSFVLGKTPSAPTTWSSSSTIFIGQPVTFYWVHNSEDGSLERSAQVEITIKNSAGQTVSGGETITVQSGNYDSDGSLIPDAEDETYSYVYQTANVGDSNTIEWRVRTSGVTNTYGDWSVVRSVKVYSAPSLSLDITDQEGTSLGSTITSYPFYIRGTATPKSQKPVGYSVSIKSRDTYQTVDYKGETVTITPDTELYNTYVSASTDLILRMSAETVNLDSGHDYIITAVVSMNSGLTATRTKDFTVQWSESAVDPNCSIGLNSNNWSTVIQPYVHNSSGNNISGYSLSVYRRDYNGELVEIQTGIDSSSNTSIVDPHPPLDSARYRIVAISNTTGAVSFTDTAPYPINCTSIVIQWDEEWESYDTNVTAPQIPRTNGTSMLILPYNIDTDEDVSAEAELVNYIGREYPTSYYGTSVTSSATWNTDVPDYDTETIYALRRLQVWKGDCYVREPHGTGYWANVTVSFGFTHLERVIPVTLTLTRVMGGL